jgi:outer membrane protein assembly factor BamD (BamD/ComL family)
MKNTVLMLGLLLALIFVVSPNTHAQGASRGPDPSTLRDSELERDSAHHLEVARLYFKTRKAYISALLRCEEVIAGNPTFSKLDEVLYIAGMSNFYLSEKRGKQAPKEPVEKYRQDARDLLSQLVEMFPESSFRGDAEKALQSLGPATNPVTEEKKP